MESIRNLLKITKNSVYALIFIVSTSYAGGDRYTINNASTTETKGGSVYFSWTVPFGNSPNNRTSFIMDNRPAVDQVIGFGGILTSCF